MLFCSIHKICGAAIVFLSFALPAVSPLSALQPASAVDMSSEPHHRLLLDNGELRVFALTVPPHQETFVRHDRNFIMVTLQEGEIAMWRQGESPVQHFRTVLGEIRFLAGGAARGLRNDSTSEYRNVTIEFKNPEVTNYGYRPDTGKWDYGPTVLDPPVDPDGQFMNSLDLEAAIANDVQLLPRDTLPAPKSGERELLIAVTPIQLDSENTNNVHLSAGEIRWLEGRHAALKNVGGAPARFVVMKIR